MPTLLFGQTASSYSVYKLENKIGQELCQVQTTANQTQYNISIKTNDRGAALQLNTSLTFKTDGIKYTSAGNTSRFKTERVDTLIAASSSNNFPASDNGSIKVKELLIAGWLKAGKPEVMQSALSNQSVKIKIVGTEKELVPQLTLTVIEIKGISNGNEVIWIDDKRKALFLATIDTEDDRREVLDDQYTSYYQALNQKTNGYLIAAYTNSAKNLGHLCNDLAITGGNLVDVVTGNITPNSLIVVKSGTITYAGKFNQLLVSPGMQVIKADGKFLLPGLWNMHMHLFSTKNLQTELLSGVTTVRDMANEFDWIANLQKAAQVPGFFAPRILSAGVLEGQSPNGLGAMRGTSTAEIRANIKKYHDAGFKQIKVYTYIKAKDLPTIVSEAHNYNMDIVGHLPYGMTLKRFASTGINGISHIHYFMNALKWKNGNFDQQGNQDLLNELKQKNIVIDPTLNVYTLMGDTKISIYKRIVKLLFDAGIPIVAGTDNEGTIAQELQSYVEAGLTPLQAIQAATVVPARFMKLDATQATIHTGVSADLLILNGNPLQDIGHLKKISTIVKGPLVIQP